MQPVRPCAGVGPCSGPGDSQCEYTKSRNTDRCSLFVTDVPVLHMIAYPFPRVWHTVQDDERIVNNDEISDITLIVKVFVCEYLHLQC